MPDRRTAALQVLADAVEARAGWSCQGTAECCHFGDTGKEPHLTEAEWSVLIDELARQGRPVPPPRDDHTCPFLSDEQRCTVYAARPLGCRTFYCHRASGPRVPHRILNELARRMEVLSADPNAKGRPLRNWLNAARREGRRRRR